MSTVQMMFIKCLFLLLIMSRTEALGIVRKSDYSSVNQRTMKIILESCYEDDSLSKPILIFGDFNEFIDKPVIRMNNFYNIDKKYEKSQLLKAEAGKIILIEDSIDKLRSDLEFLANTRWWNPKIPHFIIDKNNRTCRNAGKFLMMSWNVDIINAIYICAESMDQSKLWTVNLMANYAPHPWQLVMRMRLPRLKSTISIFSQVFYANVSCGNLNYDKTKILTDHTVTGVAWMPAKISLIPRKSYCSVYRLRSEFENELLSSIFKALDVKRRCELEKSGRELTKRIVEGTADMTFESSNFGMWSAEFSLFPHTRAEMVAIIKLPPEMSTLQKIFKIWSPRVLILAGIALVILSIILIIKNHDFSSAMLDVIRLLVYTSILTNNRDHSFRIFFTTMLILMVISNGVFQGLIAAFLTKQERISAAETLDELMKSGYKIKAQLTFRAILRQRYPKYHIEEEQIDDCIKYVLNSSQHVCIMDKFIYEKYFILSSLDKVKQTWKLGFMNFKNRVNWPLKNRVNVMIMKAVESGLVDHWKTAETYRQRIKRQTMENEWSSAEYKPVKLYKLKFAFQLLALGLLLSTVIFFLELLVAKYGTS